MKTNPFKLSLIGVLFIAVVFLATACSRESAVSTSSISARTQTFQIPGTYATYTDEAGLFSVSYPNQWEPVPILENFYLNAKAATVNLKAGLPVDKASGLFWAAMKTSTSLLPSVNVIVEPASGASDIDEVVRGEVVGLKLLDPNFQEVSRIDRVVVGKDAVLIEYTVHLSSTGPLYHNVALAVLAGNNVWTLTCSVTDDVFGQHAEDFNNITRSFKITN